MIKRLLVAALAWSLAAPAGAEWQEAKTRHFTIYSNTKEAELRELAERLERFDNAIRYIFGFRDTEESTANPVTVYVTDGQGDVGRLAGNGDIAGFYVPRADGSVAFTPRRGQGGGINDLKPQVVLFHEYAHHMILGNSEAAYPAWYSEGFAELLATAQVDKDGIQFGYAAQHRAYGLLGADALPITTLLNPPRSITSLQQDQIYGRGWLLTHYYSFNAERGGQLRAYLDAFAQGKPPLDAARGAFGDLRKLDRELDQYMRHPLPGRRILLSSLPTVTVRLRPLTSGERMLIDHRIRSEAGVNAKTAGPLYARAKKLPVPADDAVAQGWLAEMAYDAGQADEAEAAADRALAADPRSSQALLYKGRVHLLRAAKAKATDPKVWAEARSWVVKANRLDPNDAAPLVLFYDSFVMADTKPAASAVKGIYRALELMPQDPGVRFRAVNQHLSDGELRQARAALMPLAYSPHLGPDNPAAKMIALIDSGAAAQAIQAAGAANKER